MTQECKNAIIEALMDQPDYESFQKEISELEGAFQFARSIVIERKGWESERDAWNENATWGLKL